MTTYRLWSTFDNQIDDKDEFVRLIFTISRRACNENEGGVRPGYAQYYATETANWMLVAYGINTKRKKPYSEMVTPTGFILGHRTPSNIYLGVICADKGFGGGLIKQFIKYADDRNVTASLDALPNVLGLYSKDDFGFEFRKSCAPGEEILSAESVKGRHPQEDITEDPVFAPFIEKLQHHEFNVKKDGRCKNKNLTIKQIIGDRCGIDGFTMFRCGSSKAPRVTSPGYSGYNGHGYSGKGKSSKGIKGSKGFKSKGFSSSKSTFKTPLSPRYSMRKKSKGRYLYRRASFLS